MKRLALGLLLGLLALAFLAAFAFHAVQQRWHEPLAVGSQGRLFEVRTGDTLRSVAGRLRDEDIFGHPLLLIAYGRYTGMDLKLMQGEYFLPPGITPAGLLERLIQGDTVYYKVTLPEGLTLRRALAVLAQNPVLEIELSGVEDRRIAALTADYPGPEGLFLPETYHFSRGDSDWDVLQRAYTAMQETLQVLWPERSGDNPLDTPYQVLILASIIERETALPAERATIAGVFSRRLQKGMRLQTD
ncbi:MAG: endolytic transglycosylase MltG, partial [Parahaliea sp.]